MGMIMGYPGEPNVIMEVLIRGGTRVTVEEGTVMREAEIREIESVLKMPLY